MIFLIRLLLSILLGILILLLFYFKKVSKIVNTKKCKYCRNFRIIPRFYFKITKNKWIPGIICTKGMRMWFKILDLNKDNYYCNYFSSNIWHKILINLFKDY